MAILDRENAQTAQYFHHSDDCAQTVTVGPRGGITYPHVELWRRNGATQTWKTRPTEFRVPVKYGMYAYGQLTDGDSPNWHTGTAESCELGTLAQSIAAPQTTMVLGRRDSRARTLGR
jgi:hypothetical protein